ncbi:hypothetical protein H6769_03045 [Candidatus Peribacteria bacterium]|nr:hypothetical protein [Candidatus Peribacteria bacterium]
MNTPRKYSKVVDQLGRILTKLKEEYKKNPIPYVHGDTLTATTADKAAFLTKCSVVHVEAGIELLLPRKIFIIGCLKIINLGYLTFDRIEKR